MVEEDQLTHRQKKWLEASRKIGPGPVTKSERLLLEELYAKMLPQEQQELIEFIQEKFGSAEDTSADSVPEPTQLMEQREWVEPSERLKEVLEKAQRSSFGFDSEEE